MDYRSTLSLDRSPALVHDISETNLAEARHKLVALLGSDNVVVDDDICRSRSGSTWSHAHPSQVPSIVTFPKTTEDMSGIMKICFSHNIPAYAYCGGTGLGGTNVSTRRGICIDCKHMDKIGVLHEDDMDVTVGPAVGWQELNAFLSTKGLFFPPDPAPGAKIGGMIAMSCSGTNAYRYGTMKEWVISLTVVLADGSVVKTRNRPRKSSAGYDLTHLIIGSEGTLGIVTEAVLKITLVPQNLQVGIATFSDTRSAVNAAISVIKSGQPLEAIEFIDQQGMLALNRTGLSEVKWDERPTVFMKFSGAKAAVETQVKAVEREAKTHGCLDLRISGSEEDVAKWWGARKAVARAIVGMKKDSSDLFISADAAVPISRLAEIIDETHRATADKDMFCCTIGHLGDGNVHTALVCPPSQEEAAEKVVEEVQRRSLEFEGTITGEHGVGTHLRDMLIEEVGQTGVDMMRKIKFALDPKGILNCDKVFRAEARSTVIRMGS